MTTPATPRLYADLASLWPLLSPPEDYEAEATHIDQLIRAHFAAMAAAGRHTPGPNDRLSILELGAGGGHTLYHLKHDYDCTATDLSEQMLDQCRALNPEVQAIRGDMRDLDLGRTFDVVLLHDAVEYMLTKDDLLAALRTVRRHVQPEGFALVAPSYTRETFEPHACEVDQHEADDGNLVLSYISYLHDPDPADSTVETVLVYLINQNGQVRVVEDRHICGIFSEQEWLDMLQEANFSGEQLKEQDMPWEPFFALPV